MSRSRNTHLISPHQAGSLDAILKPKSPFMDQQLSPPNRKPNRRLRGRLKKLGSGKKFPSSQGEKRIALVWGRIPALEGENGMSRGLVCLEIGKVAGMEGWGEGDTMGKMSGGLADGMRGGLGFSLDLPLLPYLYVQCTYAWDFALVHYSGSTNMGSHWLVKEIVFSVACALPPRPDHNHAICYLCHVADWLSSRNESAYFQRHLRLLRASASLQLQELVSTIMTSALDLLQPFAHRPDP